MSYFDCLQGYTVFFSHLLLAVLYYYFLVPKLKFPKINFSSYNLIEKAITIAIIFIVIVTLFIGGTSPPNNWDSMTYHLSRIQYWIQNSGVHFLIQIILDKIFFRLLVNLLFFIHKFYLIQIFLLIQYNGSCFIINMIIVSLICKGILSQQNITNAFCIFCFCSMPIAILQSSSTQNDLVLSTFILLFYYYQLSGINSDSNLNIFLSGLALGLGVLTKGTAYVFLFSIGIVYLTYQILHITLFQRELLFLSRLRLFLLA